MTHDHKALCGNLKPCSAGMIGYYVYLLCNPIDGNIFYVGKGSGKRYAEHQRAARSGHIDNAFKYAKIKQILNAGLNVDTLCYADNLSEQEAFRIEKWLINFIGYDNLTNIMAGCASTREKILVWAKEKLSEIDLPKYEEAYINSPSYLRKAAAAYLNGLCDIIDGAKAIGFEIKNGDLSYIYE